VRPGRVAKLVALDAFGLPDRPPEEAPGRYEKWLNQLAKPQAHRSYANAADFAGRLRRENARLSETQADFLAAHLCESDRAGGVRIAMDPAHRRVHPVLYRRREAEACWRRVRAPVLSVIQADSTYRRLLGVSDEVFDTSEACFSDFRQIELADCGHNLHHDQPERLARIIEAFLLSD
jgi:pimeloyl-ACP methyl ester carboxylesterase